MVKNVILEDKSQYKPRLIDSLIKRYLNVFGALVIEGPRWCGKSWSGAFHSNSQILLSDSAGNYNNRNLAITAPSIVLEGENPKLIDEYQVVPSIWDAVRLECDRRAKKGLYILTGSAKVKNIHSVIHSGAGRIGSVKMKTMSLYESSDSSGLVSLKELCESNMLNGIYTSEVDIRKIAYYIVRGGWPDNLSVREEDASLIPSSYIEAILAKDIEEFEQYDFSPQKMRKLLKSLARNESTTASKRTLIADTADYMGKSLDDETLTKYLDALSSLYLIENQSPFSPRIRSSVRVRQREKRHFTDPSLAAAILGLTPERLLNDLETFGFLFESLAFHDISIYASSFGAKVFHYQDYKDNEIDIILELNDGSYAAFEVKLGANQIDEAANKLIKIANLLEKEQGIRPKLLAVIVALTNAAYTRKDGVHVIPLTALKP